MVSKAVGIIGGILGCLGGAGLFALWWFVLGPTLTTASSMNGLWTLYVLEQAGLITLPATFWTDPVLLGLNLFQILVLATFITTMPVTSVNFWGVISIDIFICVIVLVGLIVAGGILAIVGAGED